jgi:hypothetical protein
MGPKSDVGTLARPGKEIEEIASATTNILSNFARYENLVTKVSGCVSLRGFDLLVQRIWSELWKISKLG